jgi:hypothetical protein
MSPNISLRRRIAASSAAFLDAASQIKKKLKSDSSQIDEVVYEWFCAARYKNAPILYCINTNRIVSNRVISVVK